MTAPLVDAEVTAVRPGGHRDVVTCSVPTHHRWTRARPGQLLVQPVDPAAGSVLPRVHWLAGVHQDPVHGTSIDLVPTRDVPRPGDRLRLLGPLGRGFPLPAGPVPVLVVADTSAAAPVRWLVQLLRDRGCPTHLVLVADDPDDHLDLTAVRRLAAGVLLTTPAAALEVVRGVLDDPATDPAVVFATGPSGLTRAVGALAGERGRPSRLALLDLGTEVVCGTGLCGACEVRLVTADGGTTVRACLDGPVLPGDSLPTAGGPR